MWGNIGDDDDDDGGDDDDDDYYYYYYYYNCNSKRGAPSGLDGTCFNCVDV